MRSQNPYRRKIDGRTPAARARNLSGASFDLSGNITGGKDAATGTPVAYPARARRDIYRTTPQAPTVPTAQLPSRTAMVTAAPAPAFSPTQFRKPTIAPMMGDGLGDSSRAQAATAAARTAQSVRDGAAVRGAVSAEQQRQRLATYGRGPATITDPTRPAAQRPSGFPSISRTPGATGGAETASVRGKYGTGYATNGVALPTTAPAEMATAGGVTGIMDGYRNAVSLPDLQVQGPKLDIAAADPLKRKKAAMKTY